MLYEKLPGRKQQNIKCRKIGQQGWKIMIFLSN